jgi:hypothetical protein
MKRLVFALALVATVGACKKAEQQQPASQPAMSDSSKMMMTDTTKTMSDSSKMMMDTTKH